MTELRERLQRLEEDDVAWSVRAVDVGSGAPVFSWNAHTVLPSASTAKVLVLIEAARAVASGEARLDEPLRRSTVTAVGDSGLWQHLAAESLAFADVAQLVASVSDNLATNVLVHRLGGVDRVTRTVDDLGVRGIRLHDIVRDARGPADPPTLSTGSAQGCAELFRRLATADGVPEPIAEQVLRWLRRSADLSMVAAAFGLDPLAHEAPDRGLTVVNKTGTDVGTRVDAGIARGPGGSVAYGCLAQWDEAGSVRTVRDDVLETMRCFGAVLRDAVSG